MNFQSYYELVKAFNHYTCNRESYSLEEREKIRKSFDKQHKKLNALRIKNLKYPLTPLEQYGLEWDLYRENRESYSYEEKKQLRAYFSELFNKLP